MYCRLEGGASGSERTKKMHPESLSIKQQLFCSMVHGTVWEHLYVSNVRRLKIFEDASGRESARCRTKAAMCLSMCIASTTFYIRAPIAGTIRRTMMCSGGRKAGNYNMDSLKKSQLLQKDHFEKNVQVIWLLSQLECRPALCGFISGI